MGIWASGRREGCGVVGIAMPGMTFCIAGALVLASGGLAWLLWLGFCDAAFLFVAFFDCAWCGIAIPGMSIGCAEAAPPRAKLVHKRSERIFTEAPFERDKHPRWPAEGA